ncbi:flagellar motor switch protein FliN [Nitratireductor sp. CAU 1489]|uniref:Flagellar motor switch protein FliN n=1 Tax=Nitratireductor arenosus TaxID=2682096 RepID=A0A844QN98_9HYPH|nr:flagellar motor switch protein FliN [Nitratireductor arenosus]MVA99321.1 flagellar motor switch protein FliN [Nitratireductor arenosus]
MNQVNAPAGTGDDEEDLNRAIDELRGVLHEGEEAADEPAAIPDFPVGESAAPDFTLGQADGDAAEAAGSGVIMGIPVDVQIVLGSTEMQVSELMSLRKGATVALDRRIGEPVDVVVNGRKIARGEITVLESDPSRFGIRLTEIISNSKAS